MTGFPKLRKSFPVSCKQRSDSLNDLIDMGHKNLPF
jgi:hypothetical protein